VSELAKLADALGEASAQLASWQPEDLAEAIVIIAVLPDLVRDLTYMWERMADHAEASRLLHSAVPAGLRDIAALSATQELEADAVLARFPGSAGWR